MRIKRTPAEQMLVNLTNQVKALADSQAVLRDGIAEARKDLKEIIWKMEEMEGTNEVVKLSLRRKTNIEELELLEKKVYDLEEKLSSLSY